MPKHVMGMREYVKRRRSKSEQCESGVLENACRTSDLIVSVVVVFSYYTTTLIKLAHLDVISIPGKRLITKSILIHVVCCKSSVGSLDFEVGIQNP